MATPLTPTDVGGLLKKAYAADPRVQALFDNFPFWQMIKKVGSTSGESYTMNVTYQAATRIGTTPASVYTQVQLAPAAKFEITPKNYYGYTQFTGLAMAQTGAGSDDKKGANAFIGLRHEQNVTVTKTMAKLHALYLTRGGTGTIGIIDATTTVASTILILTKPSDQYNFEEGWVLQVSATDGGAPRAGSLTITTVPGNGTLVMSGNLNAGVGAIATGDFVFMNGDGQTATWPGLKSWCPFATTKGTFAGVNRDQSPRKLAGFFLDATVEQLTIDAACSALLNRYKANLGKATHGFLNPLDFEALAQTGSTNVVVDQGGDREFGFQSLFLVSDGTRVKIYEDPTFVQGEFWLVNMPDLEMRFVDKAEIAIDDRDGLELRKVGTSGQDAWEMTFYSYPYGLCLVAGAIPGRCIAGAKLY